MKIAYFLFVFIVFISFGMKQDRPYIVIDGEKYYECGRKTISKIDTLYSPDATIAIFKTTTTEILYDHFNCK